MAKILPKTTQTSTQPKTCSGAKAFEQKHPHHHLLYHHHDNKKETSQPPGTSTENRFLFCFPQFNQRCRTNN